MPFRAPFYFFTLLFFTPKPIFLFFNPLPFYPSAQLFTFLLFYFFTFISPL